MITVIPLGEDPTVSVILPYNVDRGFLREAVGSVFLQDYKSVELVLSHGHGTVGENINRGVMESNGKWIKILAEDDFLPNDSLKILSRCFDRYDWIVADAYNFGNKAWECRFSGCLPTTTKMLEMNCIHGGAVIYRKDLFFLTGGYNEELITAEEYDFHLLLLKNGYKVGYIPEIVYFYRIHEKNKYINMMERTPLYRKEYIQKNIKEIYGSK